MKRLVLSLATLAVAASSLSACGSSDSETTKASATSASATESPSESAAPADDRFQTAYVDVAALFTVLNAQSDVSPQSTEEANTAAALDESTPLVFVDYTVLPDDDTSGSFCLRSNTTDTYIAVTYSGAAGEVDLGDGECSYDTAAAAVVGDVSTDEWSVGADLMGDAVPTDLFGS